MAGQKCLPFGLASGVGCLTEMRAAVFRGREFSAAARANGRWSHSRGKCDYVRTSEQVTTSPFLLSRPPFPLPATLPLLSRCQQVSHQRSMVKSKSKRRSHAPQPPTNEAIESESEPPPKEPATKSKKRKVTRQREGRALPRFLPPRCLTLSLT